MKNHVEYYKMSLPINVKLRLKQIVVAIKLKNSLISRFSNCAQIDLNLVILVESLLVNIFVHSIFDIIILHKTFPKTNLYYQYNEHSN